MAVNHKLTHVVKDRVVQDFHLNASTGRFLSMRLAKLQLQPVLVNLHIALLNRMFISR